MRALLLLLAACSDGPTAPVAVDCIAAGLEHARNVDLASLPTTCSFIGGGPPSAPMHVLDPAVAVQCEAGSPSVIDVSAADLYVVRYDRSPASVGLAILDDGATVTLLTRFRSPCPDDPLPMPMQSFVGFWLPKGATRAWRESNCTVPAACD
jgi:hypothetical protein